MFDSHCHLDFDSLGIDLDRHLEEARACGVRGWFVPGVRPQQWRGLASVGRSDVWVGAGLHPWETDEQWDVDALCADLQESALSLGAVAVGECGFDKFRGGTIEIQRELFEAQLRLAGEMELPVVIHQVGYQSELIRSLERVGLPEAGGVVHGFGGDVSFGRALVARGLFLGVGVAVTFEIRRKVREAVSHLPLKSLLLETDAPDQAPAGEKRSGIPGDLRRVCEEIARLKQISFEVVEEATEARARSFYRLDDD